MAADATTVVEATLAVAGHLEDELEEALGEHRLTRPSFLVLDALARAEERTLGQRALVDHLRRTSGSLSVRLGRLERAGLVTRRADPDNRRSQTVTLTDRGAAVVEAARPAYERRAARLVSGLEGGAGGPAAEGLLGWLGFFEPGESTAPRLGVAVASAAVAKRMRAAVGLDELPGALVVRVSPDSPAAAAALGRGDLIRTAAGEPVETLGDLDRAVRAAGATLTLGVVRGTTEREVVVTLGG